LKEVRAILSLGQPIEVDSIDLNSMCAHTFVNPIGTSDSSFAIKSQKYKDPLRKLLEKNAVVLQN